MLIQVELYYCIALFIVIIAFTIFSYHCFRYHLICFRKLDCSRALLHVCCLEFHYYYYLMTIQ
jgi:hypothetical protein